jgi:hypothetical protein
MGRTVQTDVVDAGIDSVRKEVLAFLRGPVAAANAGVEHELVGAGAVEALPGARIRRWNKAQQHRCSRLVADADEMVRADALHVLADVGDPGAVRLTQSGIVRSATARMHHFCIGSFPQFWQRASFASCACCVRAPWKRRWRDSARSKP